MWATKIIKTKERGLANMLNHVFVHLLRARKDLTINFVHLLILLCQIKIKKNTLAAKKIFKNYRVAVFCLLFIDFQII
jgi:hypothetical protein